ncbi:MAG: hypothetical protein OXH96_06640 [Spirochaetaceae bacterium]|nr:hypothetical protein [Spirochaetaceae bacterium]
MEQKKKGCLGRVIKLFAIAVSVIVVLVIIAYFLADDTTGSGELDCDTLMPRIVKLSEENEGPFAAKILKVSEVEEVSRSETLLLCRGSAKWSRGEDSYVEFHWEKDSDGDAFIGYKRS